ncbi:MAG: hypothetical protein ACR2LG_09990 [Actinomycetota bacterium]|nr:hypothetical protein [Actinomycetota bacterium]MDQ5874870.1 hypothetical protein [Actinomycetota bacterium]
MTLWWIANAVFLLIVIPVVLGLLNRVLRPAIEIRKYVDDILEHGVNAIASLDAVEELPKTRDLIKQAGAGVGRYGAALDKIV